MKRVAVAVLAAGGSSRMGEPKQLLPFRRNSLLRHAAETALAVECGPVVVVLGAKNERLCSELDGLPATPVVNHEWELGPGTSVRAAVEALKTDPTIDAILFTLCDQPFVTVSDLTRIVDVFRAGKFPMVAAEYGGSVGVPALFAREFFPELQATKPAQGAKPLLIRTLDRVAQVPVSAADIDLDTPEDYARRVAPNLASVEAK